PATGGLVNSLAPSGLSPGNHFGFAVSGPFVTAPDASVNGQESGALFYCNRNPTLITNGGAFDRLGMAVVVGDFGFLVSEPAFFANGVDDSGRAIGSLTLQAPTPEFSAFFGARIAVLGDNVLLGGHPSGIGQAFVVNCAHATRL